MNNGVRVRYAPSPTGDPHVGNIRTALFNWLYARHTGGTFILRIEDTDQTRTVEGALEAIYDSLKWLGLDLDEGPQVGGPYEPYIQSERQKIGVYQDAADRLLQEDHAYYCYCTPEELAERRKEQQRLRRPPRYDGRCRNLSQAERQARGEIARVVRFKTPLEGKPILVSDVIRGEVTFEPSVLDDFVLLKSDGYPTYHLASVVDDHAMQVSHVLRAEEWLSSAPRHLLIYQALAYPQPLFGHLPMILGPDRSKLAKRHGATSLLDYRTDGFLSDAIFNFLALLGWSLDDKTEIIPRDDLVRHFSLERVGRSPAIFDREKLTWMNGVYLRRMPAEDLASRLEEALTTYIQKNAQEVKLPLDSAYISSIVPLVQERLKKLNPEEAWDLCSFFLLERPKYEVESLVPQGMDSETTRAALQATIDSIEAVSPFNADEIEKIVRTLAERLQLRTRELFGAIRIAVTGSKVAPPLFDTLAVLGKERVLPRLRHVVEKL